MEHTTISTAPATSEGTASTDYGTRFLHSAEGFLEVLQDATGGVRIPYQNRFDGIRNAATVSPNDVNLNTIFRRSIRAEHLGTQSEEQVSNLVDLDALRRPACEGRASGTGTQSFYDTTRRLDRILHRDGTEQTVTAFDVLQNPTHLSNNGVEINLTHDLRGRLTSRQVSGDSSTRETFEYDALDRVRVASRARGSTMTFRYELSSLLAAMTLTLGTDTLQWQRTAYPTGAPHALTYPSGVTATDLRSPEGRLDTLTIGATPLISSVTYAAATHPATLTMGPGINRNDIYDRRRRVLQRSYTLSGRTLAELRYQYDDADREIARQYLHRGGRADLFTYDEDSRVTRAEIGARPTLPNDPSFKAWPLPDPWWPGDYARTYNFDTSGEDRITTVFGGGFRLIRSAAVFGSAPRTGWRRDCDPASQ